MRKVNIKVFIYVTYETRAVKALGGTRSIAILFAQVLAGKANEAVNLLIDSCYCINDQRISLRKAEKRAEEERENQEL